MYAKSFSVSQTALRVLAIGLLSLAASWSEAELLMTGNPVTDGYTSIGTLQTFGNWAVDGGFGYNAGIYINSFTLGATDSVSSNLGTFGNTSSTPKILTTVPGWQVGDNIFSIGVVALGGTSGIGTTAQTLTFKFHQSGTNIGLTTPWAASSTARDPATATGSPTGNASSGTVGTSVGDLRTWLLLGSSSFGSNNLAFKTATSGSGSTPGTPVPGSATSSYAGFFNGAAGSGGSYFTSGSIFINTSEVARDYVALGSGTNAPAPFQNNIDFVLQVAQGSASSEAVFKAVPVPEPSTVLMLLAGAGAILVHRQRRHGKDCA